MKYLVFIIFFFAFFTKAFSKEVNVERNTLNVWTFSQKGAGWFEIDLLKKENIEDHFRENVLALHSEIAWIDAKESKYIPSLRVEKVGVWNGFDVYDLYDKSQNVKHIVIDGNDEIRLIYSLHPIDAKHELSQIIKTKDTEILSTQSRVSGTGNFFYSKYFLYDAKSREVKSLDLKPISGVLKSILPEKHSVWKGGGFNIKALSYSNSVWKEGDANCCPSGGSVRIEFKIIDNALEVISHEYFSE